jgi:hypothetical protein
MGAITEWRAGVEAAGNWVSESRNAFRAVREIRLRQEGTAKRDGVD